MSVWHCEVHGVTGPKSCCQDAERRFDSSSTNRDFQLDEARRGAKYNADVAEQAVDDLKAERERFDALWAALPFPVSHYFGGDPAEAREAVDGIVADLRDYKAMQAHSAKVTRWMLERMRTKNE